MLAFLGRLQVASLILFLLGHMAASGRAHAQDAEPLEYRTTIREALAEYHAKNFPEARALFAEAHRLMPNARTLRGLGMTAFELRSYVESIDYLQQALAATAKPLEGGLRQETERLLKRAERFVGRVQLVLTPPDTRVLLDGNPLERREGEPVVLSIGAHAFEFQAEGHVSDTRSIEIHGRENETWTIQLAPLPPPQPVATPREVAQQSEPTPVEARPVIETEREPNARPLYKNPWLWAGVGTVVVAVVVTSVVLATRDPGVGGVRVGRNTPDRGIFEALEGQP